jgi:hypothetical protein
MIPNVLNRTHSPKPTVRTGISSLVFKLVPKANNPGRIASPILLQDVGTSERFCIFINPPQQVYLD